MSDSANTSNNHLPVFTAEGFDYNENGSQWKDKFYKIPFEININKHSVDQNIPSSTRVVSNYGEYITKLAANKMVDRFWEDTYNRFSNLIKVIEPSINSTDTQEQIPASEEAITSQREFVLEQLLRSAPGYAIYSKEALTFLLSQKNCVGIKFYFCINHLNQMSLVLVGVDEKESDIGVPPGDRSVIDRFNKDLQELAANESEAMQDTNKDNGDDSNSITSSSRQETAIVEVGGPNNTKAPVITLWDAYKGNSQNDSYSRALKEFFSSR